jgi:hypothetical protein
MATVEPTTAGANDYHNYTLDDNYSQINKATEKGGLMHGKSKSGKKIPTWAER